MKFSVLDYAIVIVYLVGSILFGIFKAGKIKNTKDYFLGGKNMSWWSVGFSIVASETSTLTFISIPGLAYKSNMMFMQLIIGYFIGRLLVTFIFIPAYYNGNLETAYDFLGKRFGEMLRKITSSTFIVTRVLASGVRLFATAIPVHIVTGLDYPTSIAIIGVATLIYTYLGGLKAVVAVDVIQMFIYVGGAVFSMIVILNFLPNGVSDVITYATANGQNKFQIFNFASFNSWTEFFASPYTFMGAILGGTFLTMASHGTDQLLVQRLLGCKDKRDSQKALVLDASVIVIQFAFFLFLGLCLYAFYEGKAFNTLTFGSNGLPLTSSDEIFPKFIVENLPTGIIGLVIAGILASAMGTLSSAISSLASSTYLDLFRRSHKDQDNKKEVLYSKLFTLFWGVVLIGGAMLFTDTKNPVVELGLSIASFTYGGLLGTFLLGIFFKKINQSEAILGFIAGIMVMVYIIKFTTIAYTWYIIIGVAVTILVANLFHLVFPSKKKSI
ncbi:MAG: sodium:solute symporter [Ignavibacteria bacterium]|nr:sodium:solute symporter [Ignavibacteria bacterium]